MATMVKKEKPKAVWCTKGEQAAKKARAQIKTSYQPEFWLKSGESAKVIFLDKEPVNFSIHKVELRQRLQTITCIGKGCPICKGNFKGANPQFVSAYRIIDLRTFKKDDGTVSGGPKQKFYLVGTRLAPVVAKRIRKKQLYKNEDGEFMVAEIERMGEGTATSYQIVPIGPLKPERKAKLGDLLTKLTIDVEKDYAPKSMSELREKAEMLGIPTAADDDDDDEQTDPKDYLDDADDKDDDAEDDDDDGDDDGDDDDE